MARKVTLILYSSIEFCLNVFPRHSGSFLKRLLLVAFGAKVHRTARIYAGAKISIPKNLILEEGSCLGPNVVIYNLGKVHVKKYATISQNTKLICASHNIRSAKHELTTKSIIIGENVWIAAYCIVGPYAVFEKDAVLGLGSVFKGNAGANGIYVGNPAKRIGSRQIKS